MAGFESRIIFGKNLLTNVPEVVQITDQAVLVLPRSMEAILADVSLPAANTAAVVTYAAIAGNAHVISGVSWSYSAAPTGGNIQIADGAFVIFSLGITAAGPGFIPFAIPKRGRVGQAMVITLASGAGAVIGKVSVLGHWTE